MEESQPRLATRSRSIRLPGTPQAPVLRRPGRSAPLPILATLAGTLLSGCVTAEQLGAVRGSQEPASPRMASAPTEGGFVPGATAADLDGERLTVAELQAEMLAFADRYIEAISEAADWAADNTGGGTLVSKFHNVKTFYATAAVSIATTPDPVHILRDFIVLVELQSAVWADPGPQWAPPEASARIHRDLHTLDAQLIAFARRIMPEQAIETLHAMVNQWIREHPDRSYVAFVRFSDLGNPERRRRFAEQHDARGLLAPVSEAARELDEIRGMSERALFLANRMPLLTQWQAESFLYHTLKLPEVTGVLEDSRRLSLAAENLGDHLSLAIHDVGTILARERTQAILQLGEQFRLERTAMIQDLESSAENLLPLTESIRAAASSLSEVALVIRQIRAAGSDTESEWEITEVTDVVTGMNKLTGNAITLLDTVQLLMSADASANAVEALDKSLREQQQRLFLYAAALISMVGLVALGLILVFRWTAPR